MGKLKILLPHNFTDYDHRALDFVIRTFAHLEDVEITLFNAYTPMPEIASHVHEAQIMDKLKTNLNQLAHRIKEQKDALNGVKNKLLQNGFSDDQVHCIFKPRKMDTAGEIIALNAKDHFDMVVINHRPGKVTRFFTGSVYQKVLKALQNTTVCIVT
jgi:nucleotide-binding universal stress UspA family protein